MSSSSVPQSVAVESPPAAEDAVLALPGRSGPATRLISAAALGLAVLGLGWIVLTVYRAATDSFVAPTILSPDSDLVLTSKLRLGELAVERGRAVAEVESIDAEVEAAEAAVQRLVELRTTAEGGLGWMNRMASVKAGTQVADLKALGEQEETLRRLLEKQRELRDRARKDLEAGIITRDEYVLAEREVGQIEVALLENARARLQTGSMQHETAIVRKAIAQGGARPAMPELIARHEQLVRIELETIRLRAEIRSRRAQREALEQRIDKIDELTSQLRSRPLYQATERNLDLAFVPYTQLEGVEPGSKVYDCLWGIFSCDHVGKIAELVPGEVILPDPWGTQTRGQYAVLELRDRAAARSKVLRVRPAS